MTDTSFLSGGSFLPAAVAPKITSPDAQDDLLSLRRRQMLGQLLIQQSQQPDNSPSMIGNYYVRKSPLQALTKAAQLLLGTKTISDTDAQGVQLAKDAQNRLLGMAGAEQPQAGMAGSVDMSAGEMPWSAQGASFQNILPTSTQSSPLAIQGMPPAARAALIQNNPDEYFKLFASQYQPTDVMKNNNYMGINPQQARTLHMAAQAKDIGVEGALPQLDAQGNMVISPIPGAIDTKAAMTGALQNAQERNKIYPNMTVGGRENVPVWGSDIPHLNPAQTPGAKPNPQEIDAIVRGEGGISAGQPFSNTPVFGADKQKNEANAAFMKAQGEQLVKERPDMMQNASGITNIQDMRRLVNSDSFTGSMASQKLQISKTLKTLGLLPPEFDDAIANTETFGSVAAREVGNAIKAFGAGTGLSDADREYAAKMAGGQITLDKNSINRVLDIREKAYRNVLSDYNSRLESGAKGGLEGFYNMGVKVPPEMSLPVNPTPMTQRTLGGKTYIQQNGKWFEQ